MSLGIQKTSKCIEDVGDIIVDAVELWKAGKGLMALIKLTKVISDVKQLVEDSKGALPEIKDLDVDEAKQLSEVSYVMIKKLFSLLQTT